MPRVTNAAAQARREKVGELWVRGVSLAGIARVVHCDWETARRDVSLLAVQAVKDVDVAQLLARLLLAGRAAETAAWTQHDLAVVLGAQRQQLAVLQVVQGLDVERRLAALEEQLAGTTLTLTNGKTNGTGNGRHAWAPGT